MASAIGTNALPDRDRIQGGLFPMNVEEKERLLDAVAKTAQLYEEEYGGCGRSTLSAIQKCLGICDPEKFQPLFQSMDALTGGVAYHQEMCAAAIAGVMAIGLVYGSDKMESLLPREDLPMSNAVRKHKEAVQRGHDFVNRFNNEFDGMTCREVQRKVTGRYWDMGNQDDWALFITKPHHDKCGLVTAKAAALAVKVIMEPSENYV
jgi:hypothetical protein